MRYSVWAQNHNNRFEQHNSRTYELLQQIFSKGSNYASTSRSSDSSLQELMSKKEDLMAESAGPRRDMFSKELLKSFECPICFKYMTASVHNCGTGHSICSQCMQQGVKQCPLCKAEFGSGRNFFAEDLAKQISFPCENKVNGCNMRVLGSELQQHHVTCLYRIRSCFLNTCKWTGRSSELAEHFTDEHPKKIFQDTARFWIPTCLFGDNRYYYLMNAYGELFLWFVHANSSKRYITSCVRYIGQTEKATMFTYNITLKSKDGRRSLCYTGTTENEPSNLDTLMESTELFLANEDVYKNFADEDGNVHLHIKILRG
ncbi:E3 ubiquitin-protein ligase SIAH1B-like [Anabrus simplex]|uniref:E3 ubiquitin-protein ligase SIAH1B-like n=1 Tax=Anabrus simplex TaxID=316456 RepID=UPI0035A35D68